MLQLLYQQKGYHVQVKEIYLKMYLNSHSIGFRGIERLTGYSWYLWRKDLCCSTSYSSSRYCNLA